MSRFRHLELKTLLENIALVKIYKEDDFSNKVDLGIGINNNDYGLNLIFPIVRLAEQRIVEKCGNHDLLPTLGLSSFTIAAAELVIPKGHDAWVDNKIVTSQVLGGSGGLKVAAEFLHRSFGYQYFYAPHPYVASHFLIFTNTGFVECREYRYWSASKRCLDFEGMITDLRAAPKMSVILLYTGSHNPSGCDPTRYQWEQITQVIQEKELFPLFHIPFQGLATGCLLKDTWPIRYFMKKNMELIFVQTFSKIFGLSNERVGNLCVYANESWICKYIKQALQNVILGIYTSPPSFGAKIVDNILNDEEYREIWKNNLHEIHQYITRMRQQFRERLEKFEAPGDWSHLTEQKGMFSCSGLNERQTNYLLQRYHIYMQKNGRISMCSLNPENLDYVTRAFVDATRNIK